MNTVLNYQPEVLVDTADLSREDWLNYRRLGIGGSDAAAIIFQLIFTVLALSGAGICISIKLVLRQ